MKWRLIAALALVAFSVTAFLACDDAADFYEVSFEKNGGNIEGEDNVFLRREWDGTMPVPTRPGYTFEGWYYDPEFTDPFVSADFPDRYQEHDDLHGGVLWLYAQWEPMDVEVTVEYYLEDVEGTFVLHDTIVMGGTIGETVLAPLTPHSHYLLFAEHPDYRPSGVPEDGVPLILKIFFQREFYRLAFLPKNGTAYTASDQKWGTPLVFPEDPVRQGYEFLGWYRSEMETLPFTGTDMPDSPLTLYARWVQLSYDLLFEEYGGTEVPDASLVMGETITLPGDPVRTGFVFRGWFSNPEGSGSAFADGSSMPAADLTLYAVWDLKMVTITFVVNGGTPCDPLVAQWGSSYALPSPEYADHLFDGWYEDEARTIRHVNDGSMPMEDLTLYANWFGMTYMIHFDTMGGPYIQDFSLPSGSPLSLPTPTWTGFTFVGWYDAMLTTPFTGTLMPEANLVLYAKWVPE